MKYEYRLLAEVFRDHMPGQSFLFMKNRSNINIEDWSILIKKYEGAMSQYYYGLVKNDFKPREPVIYDYILLPLSKYNKVIDMLLSKDEVTSKMAEEILNKQLNDKINEQL